MFLARLIKWISAHEKLSVVIYSVCTWLPLCSLVRFMCDKDAYSVVLLFIWYAISIVFPVGFTISFAPFAVERFKEEYR